MDQLLSAIWGGRTSKTLTSMFALIASAAGAFVAIPPAWSAMEDAAGIARTAWVQSRIDPMLQTEAKLLIAQAQTTATLNSILLTQLQSSLYAAQRDMAAAPSPTVQERIDALNKQIRDLQTTGGSSR
jgi:hypothetical protein